jgi:hypothetical protein
MACENSLFEFLPAQESTSAAPSCAQLLAFLTDAYYRLLGGVQEVEIEYRDHKTKYSASNLAQLKSTIASLHQQCGNATSASVVGGRRRALTAVFGNCRGVNCG